jgi:GNAT superfamily N-acetyltransferase
LDIKLVSTNEEIELCYPLMLQLRPHLTQLDFAAAAVRMSQTTNYKLVCLHDNGIKALAGFRLSEWLHTGLYLEIEELVCSEGERSKGYGGLLFDWLCKYAIEQQCKQVRLVSGVKREDAHRFYLRKGMQYEAKYFSLNL